MLCVLCMLCMLCVLCVLCAVCTIANTTILSFLSFLASNSTCLLNQSSNLPKGAFNRTGRGTPDVSALGEGYQVMQGGKVTPAAGTSASTPYFASLISLINDARLQAGKKQLGFLNPWIYKNRHTAFTDITIGSNPDSHEDVRTAVWK